MAENKKSNVRSSITTVIKKDILQETILNLKMTGVP